MGNSSQALYCHCTNARKWNVIIYWNLYDKGRDFPWTQWVIKCIHQFSTLIFKSKSVSTALPDISRDWFWPWHWHPHWWSHFYLRSLELPAVEAASASSPAPTAGPGGLGNSPEHVGGTGHLTGMPPAQPRDPSAQRRNCLPRYLQLPVPPGAPEVPREALPEHGQTKILQRHGRGWDVSNLKCVSHASFILCITLKNAHALVLKIIC